MTVPKFRTDRPTDRFFFFDGPPTFKMLERALIQPIEYKKYILLLKILSFIILNYDYLIFNIVILDGLLMPVSM